MYYPGFAIRLCQKFHSLIGRLAQLAELPRSEFDPELFPHSAYVMLIFL